jgi:hypothetical protein
MVFILIKASLLGGKPSFPFDNRQQGGMGQNFNISEPSLKDITKDPCHIPFRDSGNEASIRVPRMFHSHV